MKTSTRNLFVGAALIVLVLLAIRYFNSRNQGFLGLESFESADTFTLYYAKWCPHCKSIAPVFKDFSKDGSVNVGGKTVFLTMVEADEDADKMKGKPVKGFPTFLLEKANGQSVEFDGERNPEGWKSWLAKNL